MGYIFLIDFVSWCIRLPSDAYSKQRLFEASITVYLCKQHIAQYFGHSDKITQGQRVRSCLRVRPKQGELCFTVSDVGVDLPSIVGGGLDAPLCLFTYFFVEARSLLKR